MMVSSQWETFTIQEYSPDSFHQLEPYWRQLEQGPDMTAFQSYDWYRELNSLHAQERAKNQIRYLRYIVVLAGGAPLLIAPLEIRKLGIGYKQYGTPRGVYFIGRMGETDYLNFIYRQFSPEALKAVIDYVRIHYKQSRFSFERMLENSDSYRFLHTSYPGETEPVNCSALVFPETFEEYRVSLSKSTRQNIRTAVNRAKKNEIPLFHEFIHDESPEIKEEIIALNEKRISKKNANSRKEMSFLGSVYCFFAAISRKLFSAELDVVRVSKNTFSFLVKDGDRIVSFFWGIRNDYLKEYYVILAGVDPEYEWYSPNISHLYLFIEEYYKENRDDIRVLDFTRGAEGYKKTIGCIPRPVSTLRFRIK